MRNLRRLTAFILALTLCCAFAVPAFADETDVDTGAETQPPETQPQTPEIVYPDNGGGTRDFGVDFVEVNQTVYVMAGVNVRMGPGIQYARVGMLGYGSIVTRIGIGENGWSMILYEGEAAYVFSIYLSTERPSNLAPPIDDTVLLRQVAIANGLTRTEYTKASWDVLTAALLNANEALNGDSQKIADEAAVQLEEAIAALVPMDYSKLEETLAELDRLAQTDEYTDLWDRLMSTAYDARDLLLSGNQVAVDEITTQLRELMDQVHQNIQDLKTPEIVVQEVPVEVPPTDDFCNIPMHRVWPVLFVISLVLNAALSAVIILYIYRKKKNQQDDTPLVDYDIFDDTF